MPGVGGGGGGGGFHGGGSFGGGGSSFGGGGYHGGYYGGYYRRGGIFSSILGAVLSPLIFGVVGIILIVVFFATIKATPEIKYDEDKFQEYALDAYYELYGSSEEGIVFVFLGSDDPEKDGYYQISMVGYDVGRKVNLLFGGDTTVFGAAVEDYLPQSYKNSLTTGFSYAVEDTQEYILDRIGKDKVFSTTPKDDLSPRFVNKTSFLNIDADRVQASLDTFKTETGVALSIYVASMDDVFSRSRGTWILLVVGIIFLGISVVLIVLAVKAVKAIKERRNGGSGSSGGYGGGYGSGGSGSGSYGGGYSDRYSE